MWQVERAASLRTDTRHANRDGCPLGGGAMYRQCAANERDQGAVRQETATCAPRVDGLDDEGCDLRISLTGAHALLLQPNTVILHRHGDGAIIRGERYPHGQPTVQVIATPMAARVAQRLLDRAQQQVGDDKWKRVGGTAGVIWSIERKRIERATELAVERGAQSASQSVFEMAFVRNWGGAHQRCQIVVGLSQLADDGLQFARRIRHSVRCCVSRVSPLQP